MSRLSTGRKRDHVWEKFEQLPNGRAKCKTCTTEMVPLVDRMKKHYASHENGQTSTNAGVRLPKQPVMDTFVVTTSANQKASFDKAVAKFFYACNIPFVAAESEQFKVKFVIHFIHKKSVYHFCLKNVIFRRSSTCYILATNLLPGKS